MTTCDTGSKGGSPIATQIVVDPESFQIPRSGNMRQSAINRGDESFSGDSSSKSGFFEINGNDFSRMTMTAIATATDEAVGTSAEDHAPGRPERPSFDGSCALRNYMHEQFAQEVARLSEQDALGKAGENAYAAVGFARHRHNHIRLLRRERVARRIAWLRFEREAAAQAARMSPGKVIEELHARGIERFDDLVERNAAGVVGVRDFGACLPVEIAIGALKMVHRAFGIKSPVGG